MLKDKVHFSRQCKPFWEIVRYDGVDYFDQYMVECIMIIVCRNAVNDHMNRVDIESKG